MKIDTVSYLIGRNDLRLKLSEEKREILLNKILLKYGNMKIFCKNQNLNYDTTGRWLTVSTYRRREPSFTFLKYLCDFLSIKIEDIISYPLIVGSGNSFQTIPHQILADEEFWEGFGLYYGDGQNKIGTNEFVFSNINFDLSNFIIRWFKKYFGIKNADMRVYVYFPSTENKVTASKYVIKSLKLPKESVKSFYSHKKLNSICLLTMVGNSALRYLFDEISKNAENMIIGNKSLMAAFIRGYLAAEGNVYVPKKQKICKITIGFGDKKEFELIKRYLTRLNIEFTTSHNTNKLKTKIYPKIEIHKRRSVFRLYEIGGFGYNKKRQKQFEKAIKMLRGG